MSSKTFNNTKINVEFDEDYQSRTNINSGENISSLFAKIRRFILDLKAVCFSGSYNDLSDTPDVVTKEYVDPIKSQAAINRTTLGYQCKNLLKNTASTTTVNNVTFTVNSDGSVAVNGTNTSSSNAYIQLCGLVNYGNSKLIASIGQNITDVYMAIYDSDWNWIGTGSVGTISWENSSKKRLVRLVVKPGATINNVTVYPMIRYADITDDTYEPYKESVDDRIIQNKSDIAVNKSTLGVQCKNLLNLKSKVGTHTSNGITFVINDDGSVTANGTATASVFFYMLQNNSVLGNLIYGKEVKLTGCPEGGSTSTYSLRSLNVDGNSGAVADLGNGRVFTYTNPAKSASFYIAISKGMTVTNLTFYPMLRYAEITDDTFETYKPTLMEQIEELKARITALGG